ncbi:hypothetical protein CO104_04025 [Candidatus Collierbacteria bacterium CG_4_9_14_3_um_filter_43_16]|uniref:Uncharacterized protein n=1 Tax=Candidatus Collierbacteria bacterium CG_4_9_14_3_um_filter_43_16 TaxID=1974532 RepID=A0A2M8BTS1_9BACT|nr:MAG: hypothetical protein CO104_04025 [Candidatus Collierbacteria bacterium CG_4_9_14_3_um_filter_43_16]
MEVTFAFAVGHFDPEAFGNLMSDLATVSSRLISDVETQYTVTHRAKGAVRVTLVVEQKIYEHVFTQFGYKERLEQIDAVFQKFAVKA